MRAQPGRVLQQQGQLQVVSFSLQPVLVQPLRLMQLPWHLQQQQQQGQGLSGPCSRDTVHLLLVPLAPAAEGSKSSRNQGQQAL